MPPWLIVIDDFLREPDAVRSKAVKLTYSVQGHYPGLNSVEKIPLEGLVPAVSNIVHEPLCAPWAPDFSHQSCRLSLASDDRPGRVHVDVSHLTGVLSLSRNEDSRGGKIPSRACATGHPHPCTPSLSVAAGDG